MSFGSDKNFCSTVFSTKKSKPRKIAHKQLHFKDGKAWCDPVQTPLAKADSADFGLYTAARAAFA